MKITEQTPTTNPVPFRMWKRPGGDWAIERFEGGRIVRWGLYPTRTEAEAELAIANAPQRSFADVVKALA